MQTFRSILATLVIVVLVFGIPMLATLLAGQIGLPHQLIGWLALLAMLVLVFIARARIGRLILRKRKLPPARPRRSHKRF